MSRDGRLRLQKPTSELERVDYVLENSDPPALPDKLMYLQPQLTSCRRYFEIVYVSQKDGPGAALCLDPEHLQIPERLRQHAGKGYTLVLVVDYALLRASVCALAKDYIPPARPPDASAIIVLTYRPAYVYEVWYRQGLQQFLYDISKHHEIVLFSSGDKNHVEEVVELLDP